MQGALYEKINLAVCRTPSLHTCTPSGESCASDLNCALNRRKAIQGACSHLPYSCISALTIRNRLYRTTLVSLPFPYFATIYNGKKPAKPFQTLCLSNAFGGKSHALEVKVDVFNLAYAEELPIANCTFLMQYRTFMDRINTNRLIMTPEQAVQKAARECIADGIMADYLSQKQKEVYHMLAYEWNENDARQSWKEEGIEQGIEQGIDVSFAVMDALRSGFSIEETAEKQHIAIEHVQHIANAMRSRM